MRFDIKSKPGMENEKLKALFLWKPEPVLRDYIKKGLERTPVKLIFPEESMSESHHELAAIVDVLIGWKPDSDFLEKADKLKLLINPGAGVQHLTEHFPLLKERKIVLTNGHGNAYFTAQHTVALLLAVCNRIIPHHTWMKEGKWRLGDAEAKSIPLRERHVGLLGYGHVNRWVHQFAQPFGCSVSILRKNIERGGEESLSKYYKPDQLPQFLQAIDTLVIALPSTEETIGMVGSKELDLLGTNGLVVNVARGNIIKEQDFYEALRDKRIAQAAIDVWYNYKPEEDPFGKKFPSKFPFHELDNVLLSPHRAASPLDDLQRWDDVIENIRRCCLGEVDFLNVVDLDAGY